jgi:signal peptidase I
MLNIKQENKVIKSGLDFLQSVVIAILLAAVLFIFFITPNEVEGSSMEPNYYTGDRLYTNKLSYWLGGTGLGTTLNLDYKRGDVVVVDKPGLGVSLIKRLIALPGEKIMVKGGKVYINGELLIEEYLPEDRFTKSGTFLTEGKEVTLAENKYVIMGDNRDVSNDSRFIGLIDKAWITGRIFLRIWPIEKFGIIQGGASHFE